MRNLKTLAVLAAATLAGIASLAADVTFAQESRGGGGAASAQMVAELQQLSAESSSLKAQNVQLQQQLAAARKERDALRQGTQASDVRIKASQAALARSTAQDASDQQRIAQLQAATQQLIAKFRELVQTLRQTEIEAATARQTLAMRQQDLKVCADRNQALYALDDEVLRHFERQGFLTRLASDEPFTRIERVRLENFADESRADAQDQKYTPPGGANPAN